jgi:hypothetical protein
METSADTAATSLNLAPALLSLSDSEQSAIAATGRQMISATGSKPAVAKHQDSTPVY